MLTLDKETLEFLRLAREAALESNLSVVDGKTASPEASGVAQQLEIARSKEPWILHSGVAKSPRPLHSEAGDPPVQIFYQDLDFRLHTR